MEIKIAPRSAFPGRGPCIQMTGDWVTEDVWHVVNQLMMDNWITSPVYQARQKSHAFFQGGSDNSKGKWILLEFWTDEDQCAEFVQILNDQVNKVINEYFTKICLIALGDSEIQKNDFDTAVSILEEEYGYKRASENEIAGLPCSAAFFPKDNIEYEKIYQAAEYTLNKFVQRTRWLDKWETTGQSKKNIQVEIPIRR